MDLTMTLVWLGLVVVFVVIEGANPQLVSIWFAGGAIAGCICALCGVPLYLQTLVFVGVSAILLLATRPFVKKVLKLKTHATNSDSNIGKTGLVTEQIDNVKGIGQVNLAGMLWTARSVDDAVIEPGMKVRVERIEGVKLIVSAVPEQQL